MFKKCYDAENLSASVIFSRKIRISVTRYLSTKQYWVLILMTFSIDWLLKNLRGRVQTTWTEFWAILTPPPPCRYFYCIALIKYCGHLSNPHHLSTWFVHIPLQSMCVDSSYLLYNSMWIYLSTSASVVIIVSIKHKV